MGDDFKKDQGVTNYEIKLEQAYHKDEFLHFSLYHKLAAQEKNRGLKKILLSLAAHEKKHYNFWSRELKMHGAMPKEPFALNIQLAIFNAARQIFGIAFVMKLLEKEEDSLLAKYEKLMRVEHKKPIKLLNMLNNEKESEYVLLSKVQRYEASLYYIKSIVFGLNDGLVEVLAVVAGLAAFAVGSSTLVAITGFIVSISGSLSMAAGAYLSSKSEKIVSTTMETSAKNEGKEAIQTDPLKEAYYTGIFYFLGTLFPIAPFAFGISGYLGIGIAMLLTAAVLILASIVISVVGNESIKKRIVEMLTISFGVAILTMIIGTLARIYLGISV